MTSQKQVRTDLMLASEGAERAGLLTDGAGTSERQDGGEGTAGISEQRLIAAGKEAAPHHKTYGMLSAYSVSINYVIGAGVLGLPNAFYQAGIPLTWMTMGFFFLVSILCCWWVVEALARAHGLREARSASSADPTAAPQCRINHGLRLTFFEMSADFGGAPMKIFCELMLALYCYGCLWAYTASFSSSLSTLVVSFASPGEHCDIGDPAATALCKGTYYGSLALFAVIVVPLAMMGLTEQKLLQNILAFYRFAAFGVMILTVIVALALGADPPHANASSLSSSEMPVGHNVWSLRWAGFGLMFPTAVFATNLHYNLPDTLTPCKRSDKLLHIATAAESTAVAFYFVLGTLCGAFFVPPSKITTLDWANYTGRDGGWGAGSAHWWAVGIKLFVVLFPVLDLANVFPLVSYSLSGNIEPLLAPKLGYRTKTSTIVSRLLAVVPPLVLGAALGDVEVIFTITGLCAFFLQFIIPAGLQWFSRRYYTKLWGAASAVTQYTGGAWRSGTAPVVVAVVVGLAAWLYATVASCIRLFGKK